MRALRAVRYVRRKHLTYLDRRALLDLRRFTRQIESRRLAGMIVEVGCALGGSAIVLAASKSKNRALCVYDTFEGMPPPSAEDGDDVRARYGEIVDGRSDGIGGNTYYGYRPDLLGEVVKSFEAAGVDPKARNVRFIKGLIEETMFLEEPVVLAHVDCDWYLPVLTALQRVWPRLEEGGRIVIDDYDAYSGCRRAVDEFVASTPDVTVEHHARLHLVRSRANA